MIRSWLIRFPVRCVQKRRSRFTSIEIHVLVSCLLRLLSRLLRPKVPESRRLGAPCAKVPRRLRSEAEPNSRTTQRGSRGTRAPPFPLLLSPSFPVSSQGFAELCENARSLLLFLFICPLSPARVVYAPHARRDAALPVSVPLDSSTA